MKRIALPTILTISLLGIAGAANSLEHGDLYAIDEAAQQSLEYARTDESTRWINPDTGTAGTFTPVATHEGPNGQVCREYSITAVIAGRDEQVYGVACRQPDGTWLEANAEQSSVNPPAPATEAYPPTTAVYPGWNWWGLASSLAFSGSYCFDGFCFGGRYGYSYPYAYYPYSYYPYSYYPYGFGFSYSYYDYDHGDRHHGRSHYGHGSRNYGHDGQHSGKHGSRGGHSYGGRSKSVHSRGGRSHDRSSRAHSRGGRSGRSRVSRASHDH